VENLVPAETADNVFRSNQMYVDSIVIHNNHFPARDNYPFNISLLKKTGRMDLKRRVAFFVGDNGSGKSSVLEAIARNYGLTVWGGEKTHILHGNPFETRLSDFISLKGSWPRQGVTKGFLFRSENFFNYASSLDDIVMTDPGILDYYGGVSLHEQSHGQAFLSFFKNRCVLNGLYLLDEPEAALSPANQLTFLKVLRGIVETVSKVQFVICTHSPIILGYPGAQTLSFDHVPITEISYEETKSFKFYRDFLNDPDSYLTNLNGLTDETGGNGTE